MFLGTDARGVGTGSKHEAGASREVAVALGTAWYRVHWAGGARLRTLGEFTGESWSTKLPPAGRVAKSEFLGEPKPRSVEMGSKPQVPE